MNNKITLYELLGKIKDGQAPKRIKFGEDTFIFEDGRYYEEFHINDVNGRLGDYFALDGMLNNEVEILDNEDEDIEEIKYYDDSIAWVIDGAGQLSDIDKIAIDKINELVREINKLKKGNHE